MNVKRESQKYWSKVVVVVVVGGCVNQLKLWGLGATRRQLPRIKISGISQLGIHNSQTVQKYA